MFTRLLGAIINYCIHIDLTFMGPCIVKIFLYLSNKMQRYTVYFFWKLLYMFRVVPSPIIRSANNCIYSICYLSHRYCYLSLSWKSWNWFECAVGGVRMETECVYCAVRTGSLNIMQSNLSPLKACHGSEG
jgi:hypothetical protein